MNTGVSTTPCERLASVNRQGGVSPAWMTTVIVIRQVAQATAYTVSPLWKKQMSTACGRLSHRVIETIGEEPGAPCKPGERKLSRSASECSISE